MRSVRKKKFCAMLLYAIAVLFAAVCMFAACGQKHEHVYIDGKCACGALDEDYTPPKDRFIGNVFQIVTKTLGGQVYARGSGVVINSDGWFITNSHVMEGAYYADAYFEIPNAESGESVTRLKIAQAAVDDPAKDFSSGRSAGMKRSLPIIVRWILPPNTRSGERLLRSDIRTERRSWRYIAALNCPKFRIFPIN